MAAEDQSPKRLAPDDRIQMIASHRPRLQAGDYRVEVGQEFEDVTSKQTKQVERISVTGERYAIKSTEIQALFPPPGGHGAFHQVLPHVALKNSLLPWIRSPRIAGEEVGDSPSWLALLLFKADEAPPIQTLKVSELEKDRTGKAAGTNPKVLWKSLPPEVSDHPDDAVQVIDAPWSQLIGQLPTYNDLKVVSHVRAIERADPSSGDAVDPEVAMVVGNRLPPENEDCVMHLVSLEGRYSSQRKRPTQPGCEAFEIKQGAEIFPILKAAADLGLAEVKVRLDTSETPRYSATDTTKFSGQPKTTAAQITELLKFLGEGVATELATSGQIGPIQVVGSTSKHVTLRVTQVDALEGGNGERLVKRSSVTMESVDVATDAAAVPPEIPALINSFLASGLQDAVFTEGAVPTGLGEVSIDLGGGLASAGHYSNEALAKILGSASDAYSKRMARTGKFVASGELKLGAEQGHQLSISARRLKGSDNIRAVLTIRVEPENRVYLNHLGAKVDDGSCLRLVTLKSWAFHCDPAGLDFLGSLQNLNCLPKSEALPSTVAGRYLARGHVPLKHHLRQGGSTVSWYRGPLLPELPGGGDSLALPLPAATADELLIFNEDCGMFDTSYAAAWELGRSLALADTKFSLRLYQWKRARKSNLNYLRQQADLAFLPVICPPPDDLDLPQDIADWLQELTRLEGIPFNHLVPEEGQLPEESIRFFTVDPLWLECLRDGAMSIGRVLQSEHAHDHDLHHALPKPPLITGFIMRSKVVSGFPKMSVAAYADSPGAPALDSHLGDQFHPMLELRRCQLGPNTMLGLYGSRREAGRGTLDILEFHLPPEVLHFGLEKAPVGKKGFQKLLRSPLDGDQLQVAAIGKVAPDEVGQLRSARVTFRTLKACLADGIPLVDLLGLAGSTLAHDLVIVCDAADPKVTDEAYFKGTLKILLGTKGGKPNYTVEIFDILNGQAATNTTLHSWTLSPASLKQLEPKLPPAVLMRLLGEMLDPVVVDAGEDLEPKLKKACGTGPKAAAMSEKIWEHSEKHLAEILEIGDELWRDRKTPADGGSGILDLTRLFSAMGSHLEPVLQRPITGGDFGLQMLDAAPMLRIRRTQPNS